MLFLLICHSAAGEESHNFIEYYLIEFLSEHLSKHPKGYLLIHFKNASR
jgi:hypothetical protein